MIRALLRLFRRAPAVREPFRCGCGCDCPSDVTQEDGLWRWRCPHCAFSYYAPADPHLIYGPDRIRSHTGR